MSQWVHTRDDDKVTGPKTHTHTSNMILEVPINMDKYTHEGTTRKVDTKKKKMKVYPHGHTLCY